MRPIRLFFLATLLALAGCANVQPVLKADAKFDPQSGYVAGQFTRMKTAGFAFVVKHSDGREFTMPLGEDSQLPTEVKNQTVAIQVPPGTYTIGSWITYATMTKEIISRNTVTNPVLNKPFEVKPGHVVHLGSYLLSTSQGGGYPTVRYEMRIQPRPASQQTLQTALDLAYPQLAGQPLRCVLCLDGVLQNLLATRAAQQAASAAAAASAPVKEAGATAAAPAASAIPARP